MQTKQHIERNSRHVAIAHDAATDRIPNNGSGSRHVAIAHDAATRHPYSTGKGSRRDATTHDAATATRPAERISRAHQQALADTTPAEQPRFLQVYSERGGIFTTTNPIHLSTVLQLQGWSSGYLDRYSQWREYKTNGAGGIEHARLKLGGSVISIDIRGTVVTVGVHARAVLAEIAEQQQGGR